MGREKERKGEERRERREEDKNAKTRLVVRTAGPSSPAAKAAASSAPFGIGIACTTATTTAKAAAATCSTRFKFILAEREGRMKNAVHVEYSGTNASSNSGFERTAGWARWAKEI